MQPLATTKRVMTWLCMHPADETSSKWQKLGYVAFNLTISIFNLIVLGASFAFCIKKISTDFEGATFAFMVVVSEFGLIYMFFTAILFRYQIAEIFTSLSTIYKTNENDVEFRFMAQANNTCEWIWTIYFKCIKIVLTIMGTVSLFSVLYCYLSRGDLNASYFYHTGKFVLPWNQTTLSGYFSEIGTTISAAYGYLIVNGALLLLFISMCIHHRAFYKLFKHKIDNSEQCDAKFLCDLTRFHISVKDWFIQSANVYTRFVSIQLICSSVIMAVSVFYMDLQLQRLDFIVITIILTTLAAMANLFLYCYFGKLATESYEMMSDCAYNMSWYEQPNKLQKHFILMIANMQKPVFYHGLKITKIDLNTFITVNVPFLSLLNAVYSYYMAIKTIAAK